MKNSGIEWIGEIPDSWEYFRLKDYYEFEKGKNAAIYTQEYIGTHPGEFPVYSGQTENDGVMGNISSFDYDEEECLFTTTVGAKVMTPKVLNGKFSLSQNCLIMKRVKPCCNKYVFYQLFPLFDYTKSMIPTYMQPSLRISDLNTYGFFSPNEIQQKKIADHLDDKCAEVDKLIEVQQAQIDKLKEYKQSVITEAVTKGLDPTVPMKDSGVEWIGMIPEGWGIRRGKTIFRQRNERGNEKCLQLLSPTQHYGVIPQELYDKISGMTAVKLNLSVDLATMKTIHKRDYCISLRSFQGGFEYSIYEGVVSPAYQVFYAFEEISDEYYKYLFKEKGFIAEMNSFTLTIRDGKNISFVDFANSVIPYPPIKEQQKIADYLDGKCAKIDKLIAIKQAKIDKLQEYKKSLIYEYVTGKKEVM